MEASVLYKEHTPKKLVSQTSIKTNSFQIQELLQHLQIQFQNSNATAANKTEDCPSDVTAFMVFFSHWVKHRFDNITVRGAENINPNRNHIFISNHRDILLDPVLVNHALISQNHSAARCIIGSNLTEDPSMAALMKLAGCLEVPRGNLPLKQKFVTLKRLSQHIQNSLPHHNVWIAQREGRAKEGFDQTNPAVLKMLTMAKEKGQSQTEFLTQQSIIPVAISYQWDPSDTHKALETYLKGLSGSEYSTATRTDTMEHLIDSLDRCQGEVEIRFGTPLVASDNIDDVAQHIDDHVHNHYKLFDSHHAAHHIINKTVIPEHLTAAAKQLKARASQLPAAAQRKLIQSYANSYQQVHVR